MDVLWLVGRLAFVAIFLTSGPAHFLKRESMVRSARRPCSAGRS
jgi:hypothetical protein